MANCVHKGVEGIGVGNCMPENPIYFTQISIPELVTIPEQKPDMEQLLSVMVDAKVKSVRAADTCIAYSYEGQNLSGQKLIVEIQLLQKIKYVADEPTQSIHAAHFEKCINSIFIVVPCHINGISVKTLLDHNKVVVKPYIEDIFAQMRNKRDIFKNITLLLDVNFIK
ncbi:hypothetical protein [Inediibacterium massiliense]|uniref:hypothetical protein n=1 Tax=Inediibacterium massiliense TaxID=1658111 RepID=UPI0006B569B3|nr:hypothetical protein [Inediibacterium massiliense]